MVTEVTHLAATLLSVSQRMWTELEVPQFYEYSVDQWRQESKSLPLVRNQASGRFWEGDFACLPFFFSSFPAAKDLSLSHYPSLLRKRTLR